MDILFLVGRIIFGGYFLYSGFGHFKNSAMMAGYAGSKGVPSPKLAVIGSGVLIFLGGLGVILGIYPRISLGLIALFLLFVTLKMHDYWKETDPMAKMGSRINFLKNLALLGASLMLMALPAVWVLSL